MLDVMVISDVSKVISEDTFLRPIYAGNAFATVKSTDKKKCITIRPTSFDPAETEGGSAEIVKKDSSEANYSSILTIWDRIFFTYKDANDDERNYLGLDDRSKEFGIINYFKHPLS